MALGNHLKLALLVGGVAVGAGEMAQREADSLSLYMGEPGGFADFTGVASRNDNESVTGLLLPVAEEPESAVPTLDTANAADQTLADSCTPKLDLVPQQGAMIGISLSAPCFPLERIVISHAGLAVTGQTTSEGAHFSSLAALEQDAQVKVRFDSGETVEAALQVPDLQGLRRVAVQWVGDDAFQIHAFDGDADYFEPGHFSALRPGSVTDGKFVTVLGDPSVEVPLLAEVFTEAAAATSEILIEAETTAVTCGREISGEVIERALNIVTVSELVLAMPECDGIGDIVVLKNLVSEMKLAAAK